MIQFENLEILNSTGEENKILDRLDNHYLKFSEMFDLDRRFLNSMILRHKPSKILELGPAAGSSSVIILNAIRDDKNTVFHSIDYLNHWYRDSGKKAGFVVDKYPDLKENRKLHTGSLALSFLDEIEGGIDFCFIDTVHSNPGEILDFLMVLPYLAENAVVVFHDTKFFAGLAESKMCEGFRLCDVNNLLMSAISGKKCIPEGNAEICLPGKKIIEITPRIDGSKIHFPNIGAVLIDSNTRCRIWDVFNLLTLQWWYMPNDKELYDLVQFLARHYDPLLVKHFEEIIRLQKIYQPWLQKIFKY